MPKYQAYKEDYYPFTPESDGTEEYGEPISAETFSACKEKIKESCDIFGTTPDITFEDKERLEWKNDRGRYSNCIFFVENTEVE